MRGLEKNLKGLHYLMKMKLFCDLLCGAKGKIPCLKARKGKLLLLIVSI